ncbi:MAG: formylglycine-generating enzyme family protein, partial [Phycisphaerales bacterium]|nr:formylglycine-generating enzyme family protein [Phycisphaerales bacterium]
MLKLMLPRPALAVLGLLVLSAAAVAQTNIPLSPTAQAAGARLTTDQGIQFVTIGSPGNAPWAGNGVTGDRAVGRGSVPYEYRIGRTEVTTAQWAEFFSAALDRPASDTLPHVSAPGFWGAAPATPLNPGGRRFAPVPGRELSPAGNIGWRTAAMYCNWLHNDKRTDRDAFLSGAYDVSTFGDDLNGFTDQRTRSPGARFFIPTWDEWLKAAHFDPNKAGPGQGGWWQYSLTSDTQPTYGPPGVDGRGSFWGTGPSQANSGWSV